MKNVLILVFSIISMFYYMNPAQAGTLLEPYAGMTFGSNYSSSDISDGEISGTVVGARLGFQQLGFMVGVDGRRSSFELKPKSGTDSEYTFNQLGFFVGYDFPILLRFWLSSVISLEGQDNENSSNKLTGGSGTVLGIGYKVMPFVSINFEYSATKTTGFESSIEDLDQTLDYKTYLLSISLPLSF